MNPLQTLSAAPPDLWPTALSVVRPATLGLALPMLVFGLPWVLRWAIAAALALGLAAATSPPLAGAPPAGAWLGEAGVGLALALAGGLAIWAAQGAGRAMGALAAQGGPGMAVGAGLAELLGLGAVTTLLTAGLHRPLLRLLAMSYDALPVGAAGGGAFAGDAQLVAAVGGRLVAAMAATAAPVLAGGLLIAAVTVALRAGVVRMGPRVAAGLAHAPLAALAVVAIVAAMASSGVLDDAAIRGFDLGLEAARSLLGSP